MIRHIVSFSLSASCWPAMRWAGPDAAALYAQNCASCHADTRLGGTGPALIPESLGRLKGEKLEAVIANGRPATQMQGFGETLSKDEIAALAALVVTPLARGAGLDDRGHRRHANHVGRLQACRRLRYSPPTR